MEIVVGREYVYGRFNATATVVTVLEGYVPVEIRLQNDRTCWVHRTELRETVTEDMKPEAHADAYLGGRDAAYYWRAYPESFVLEEDVTYQVPGGGVVGVKKGTTLYIRATHDVFDRFLLSVSEYTQNEGIIFEASGQWVMSQKSPQDKAKETTPKVNKLRLGDFSSSDSVLALSNENLEKIDAALGNVLDEEKETTKQNRRTIWSHRFDVATDAVIEILPYVLFVLATVFMVLGYQTEMLWAIGGMLLFAIVRVIDTIYLAIYKLGRKQDAYDSER